MSGMTPELITAIVVALIAGITGPGLYQYLGRKKDQPIKDTEVDITVATSINKVALDTLAAVGGISKELKADLAAQKTAAEVTKEEHDRRIKCVEGKLKDVQDTNRVQERALTGWRMWYAGIERNWLIIREATHAPTPPEGEATQGESP